MAKSLTKSERRKQAQPQRPRSMRFTLPVAGMDVEATLSAGTAVLSRKARVDGRHVRLPAQSGPPGDARVSKGPWLCFEQEVPAVHVELHLPTGVVRARACCKPPDGWNFRLGRSLAVGRLLREPAVVALHWQDRRAIRQQLLGTVRHKSRSHAATDSGSMQTVADQGEALLGKRLATEEEARAGVSDPTTTAPASSRTHGCAIPVTLPRE